MKQVITKEFIEELPNTITKNAEEYRKAFHKKIKRRKAALKRLEKLLTNQS